MTDTLATCPRRGNTDSIINLRAATVAPNVCELEGPTPILDTSKMLRNAYPPLRASANACARNASSEATKQCS